MQKLLTLKEMAEKLNRDARTLKKYVRLYDVPHIKLGRDLLFNEQRVVSYLENISTASQTEAINVKLKPAKKTDKKPSANPRYDRLLGLI